MPPQTPGDGYALDPDELEKVKGTLRQASDKLDMRDFTERASLEGALTTQDVSPYENVEETVEETILKLTKFVDQDYPAVVQSMQDFINRVHSAIETGVDNVHRSLTTYNEQEQEAGDRFRGLEPN